MEEEEENKKKKSNNNNNNNNKDVKNKNLDFVHYVNYVNQCIHNSHIYTLVIM